MELLKLHHDFITYHQKKNTPFIIFQGGRRSGKTVSILQFLYMESLTHPHTRTLIVTDTYARLKESIFQDLIMINRSAGGDGRRMRIHFTGGTRVLFETGSEFAFVYAGRDVRGYASNFNYIFFNECIQYDARTAREALKAAGPGCQVFFDYNPYTRFWVNDLYETAGNKLITTYHDNPFLSDFVRRELDRTAAAGETAAPGTMERYLYEVECQGIDSTLSGLCFPHHRTIPDEDYHTSPLPEILACDWGALRATADPDVICGFRFASDAVYCHEYYYSREGGDAEMAAVLRSIPFRRQYLVYDTATEGADRIRSLFARTGLRFNFSPARKGAGSILTGIRNLQSYEICVTASSRHFLEEMENYRFIQKNDTLQPVDNWNHCCDALRYAFDLWTMLPAQRKNVK